MSGKPESGCRCRQLVHRYLDRTPKADSANVNDALLGRGRGEVFKSVATSAACAGSVWLVGLKAL